MAESIVKALESRVEYLIDLAKKEPAQKSEEWLEKRLKRINGSEISSAIGCSKYKNKKQFVKEKTIGLLGNHYFKGNQATQHGEDFEEMSAKIYVHLNPGCVAYQACHLCHKMYDFIGCTPDYYIMVYDEREEVIDVYLLEIKCPHTRIPSDFVPEEHYHQTMLQMEITEMRKCKRMDSRFTVCSKEIYEKMGADRVYKGVCVKAYNPIKNVYTIIHPARPEVLWSGMTTVEDLEKECEEKAEDIRRQPEKYRLFEPVVMYWFLEMYFINHIDFDETWFPRVFPTIENTWKEIQEKYVLSKANNGQYIDPPTGRGRGARKGKGQMDVLAVLSDDEDDEESAKKNPLNALVKKVNISMQDVLSDDE